MDQTSPADQGLLRHQRECREDADLDCGVDVRAGGDRTQAVGAGRQLVSNPTDSQRVAFRENAHWTKPLRGRTQHDVQFVTPREIHPSLTTSLVPNVSFFAEAWSRCFCSEFHLTEELSMTSLRQRMIEDMRVRNLAVGTQTIYLHHVSQFARYFGKSPAALGREQIRAFQVYLTQDKKLDPSTITVAVSALRFLYKVTLRRQWSFDEIIPAPKRPQRLPVIPSPEEVRQFLGGVPSLKHRTILTSC